MPKLKTRKSVVKRFKVTGTKKLMKQASGKAHFNTRETGKTRRNRRRDIGIDSVAQTTLKRTLPYI